MALTAIAMTGGTLGLYAVYGTFFFMSVMFPTIFALGIRGLGDFTKLGASLIVMSIVGGAIAPPCMGRIADAHSMRVGFAVPLVCFVLIAIYGLFWQKLEDKDAVALKLADGNRWVFCCGRMPPRISADSKIRLAY